jgi:hypothetical protein
VVRVLGPPTHSVPDAVQYRYEWTVLNGVRVWPLCFSGEDRVGTRALVLEFDGGGVLRSYHVEKQDKGWDGRLEF